METGNYDNIIAPLDFDLSFFGEEFINIDYSDESKYGTNDMQ